MTAGDMGTDSLRDKIEGDRMTPRQDGAWGARGGEYGAGVGIT